MCIRRPYVFLLVFLALAASLTITIQPISASGDYWVERAPMPTASAHIGAVVVNGEIYVIGSNFTYVYNPSTNSWASKRPQPITRYDFAVAVYQDKIYAIGGYTGPDSNAKPTQFTGPNEVYTGANEVYDPAKDTWATKAPMSTARGYLQANVVNGKIYLIGGTNQAFLATGQVYDPSTDSWNSIASMPIGVYAYASAVLDGKIYIFGGYDFNGPATTFNLNQIYDVEKNDWTFGESIPGSFDGVICGAAAALTGTLANQRIYVIGGQYGNGGTLNTTLVYDPHANSWTYGASMPTSRLGLGAAVVNDTIYVIGGISTISQKPFSTITAENEEYFPLGYQGQTPPIPEIPSAATIIVSALVTLIVAIAAKKKYRPL